MLRAHLASDGHCSCICRVSPYLPARRSKEDLGAPSSRGRDRYQARAKVWAELSWDLRDLPSCKLIPSKSLR